MKAALYAVRGGSAQAWQWYTSICWDADAVYWRSRPEGIAGLWLARPALSFGQAEWLRRMFEARQQQEPHELPSEIISYIMTSAVQHPFPMPAIAGDYIPSIPITQNDAVSFMRSNEIQQFLRSLAGRHLLVNEALALAEHHVPSGGLSAGRVAFVLQLGRLQGLLQLEPGIRVETAMGSFLSIVGLKARLSKRRYTLTCERCGSGGDKMHWTACPHCGQACPYCEECLTMGRVRACSPLVFGGIGGRRDFAGRDGCLDVEALLRPWGLSDAQADASRAGLAFLAGEDRSSVMSAKQADILERRKAASGSSASLKGQPSAFLIWAVTGAGKTEMIFPFIAAALARGGRALVATPRKDVVLELSPRVQRAFPDARAVTLYGGSEERWDIGEIVIATTHQLMRFHEAFDVVVIDELDAFPYHNNPMLAHAARKACKPEGRYILLSATPPAEIKRSAVRGRLPHVKVPARYHRQPLPVPQLLSTPSLKQMHNSRKLSRTFLATVQHSLQRGAQLFIFVPGIALVEPLVSLLQRKSANFVVKGTSSKDPERVEKVQAFRDGAIRILVTTTILERGVTIPKSDVIVLDADSRLFDEASLVQMAGRAGRSKLDPTGNVSFLARERTRAQTAAVRQIRSMNRLARKRGFLDL